MDDADKIARAAMQALIQKYGSADRNDAERIAKRAYEVADAMMAEAQRRNDLRGEAY